MTSNLRIVGRASAVAALLSVATSAHAATPPPMVGASVAPPRAPTAVEGSTTGSVVTYPGGTAGVGVVDTGPRDVGNLGITIGRSSGTTIYAPGDGGTALGSDLYVVQPGDTLWDLCGYFFGNPYLWPKIWAYNPIITNPHWIYPGDVLRLAPASGAVSVAVPETKPGPVYSAPRPLAADAVYLNRTAYVSAKEYPEHGTIVGAKEDKFLLSVYDTIYLEYAKEKDLPSAGSDLTIYERSTKREDLERPKDARALGALVTILGSAKVTRVDRERGIVTADVTEAFGTIERGHSAGPIKRAFGLISPVRNAKELTGKIVEGIRDEELVGLTHLVVVDKGADDGVETGNRFLVLRRGDGLPGPLEARTEKKDAARTELPFEQIAELIAVEVKAKTSTCYVTKSVRDVNVGDAVLMKKGY